MNSAFCNAYVLVWSWMDEMKVSSVLTPWCVSPQWQTLLEAPTSMLIPVFEIERVTELLSFIFAPPLARFPLIECVSSIHGGFRRGGWVLVGWLVGWGRGRRRREGWGGGDGGGFCGTSRRDERGLSLFYSPRLSSFQLFEASHQTGLNSRRDTICLSTTTTSTSLLGISSTHPSILPSLPIYLDSVLCIYLRPPTSVQPFTRSQCLSVTADRKPEGKQKKKLKFSLNVNIEAADLYFLYFLFTQCEWKWQGHSMATPLFTPMFIHMDFSCRQ